MQIDRADLPFWTLTGLVDADRYSDIGILFPAARTDPAFAGVLPRGTPVVQCFAVPRAPPELVFAPFSAAGRAGGDRLGNPAEHLRLQPERLPVGVQRRLHRARLLAAQLRG